MFHNIYSTSQNIMGKKSQPFALKTAIALLCAASFVPQMATAHESAQKSSVDKAVAASDHDDAKYGHSNASVESDYYREGQEELQQLLNAKMHQGNAKNLIIFIGDGMGISTITAGRIYEGQANGKDGESWHSAMDALPFAALVKTYSADHQVSDLPPRPQRL